MFTIQVLTSIDVNISKIFVKKYNLKIHGTKT